MRKLALFLFVLCFCSADRAMANEKATAVVNAAVDGFIRLAYLDLERNAGALDDAMDALCAKPSSENLEAARQAFRNATYVWSYVEIIRFGPVTEENRLERLLFWPDRKGIGLKQVQATLAGKDEAAADPDQLAGKSVAVQGFGALEFVLFGTDSDALAVAGDPYRCRYGAAIAVNIAGIAGDMEAEWSDPDGFSKQWANPSPSSRYYQTGTEAVTELLGVFVNGLELMRDVRLNGFLGKVAGQDKSKQAIYWRSEGTVRSLEAQMEGMKDLFDASGLGENLPPDSRWLAESIDVEFANAINAAKAADGPIAGTLADETKRGKLGYFNLITSSLSDLFGKRLSEAYGLTAGFSSLDGD